MDFKQRLYFLKKIKQNYKTKGNNQCEEKKTSKEDFDKQ